MSNTKLIFTSYTMLILAVSSVFVTSPAAYADSIRTQEWFLAALDVSHAYTITKGKGVIVGVIDTGVDAEHSDLRGNILSGMDIVTGKGNGHTDASGHGTSMAGLIAGHGHGLGQNEGIIGIAPEASILPVRVNVADIGSSTTLAPGIDWAVAHGAKVICLALGEAQGSPELERTIAAAERADVVVVAAIGNKPPLTSASYPAAYPGVVAAAGTDEHGRHAAVSVTGPQVVLSAPATNIVSTYKDDGYGVGTGTSGATAIIAGAAALVWAKFPKLSAVEVIHRLTATAIDKGPPGRDDEYGYGIVNLVGALTANVPPLTPTPSPSASPQSSPPPSVSASGSGHSTSWLPLAAAMIALFAVLGFWTVARRSTRSSH